MTSNPLDPTKALAIIAEMGPGSPKQIELEGRLQAIVNKLLAMRAEVEDKHTGSIRLDLGEERGDRVRVKAKVEKVY
jgi:hypothetical protein